MSLVIIIVLWSTTVIFEFEFKSEIKIYGYHNLR